MFDTVLACPACGIRSAAEHLSIASTEFEFWLCLECGHVWKTAKAVESTTSDDRRHRPHHRSLALGAHRIVRFGPVARRPRPLSREYEYLIRQTFVLQDRTIRLLNEPFRRREHQTLRKRIQEYRDELHEYIERRRAKAG